MIRIPTKGFAVSINAHNVDLYILCDWIEANALFLGDNVTGSDLVDTLIENNIYRSQEFAWERVDDALSICDVRARLLGDGYPFHVMADGLNPKGFWDDYAPYAFCLMLSMAKSHGTWVKEMFGTNFTAQGELFEELTAEAVAITLPGWRVHATGWTRTRTARIEQVVKTLCTQLNESAGEVLRWTAPTAKEAGLDLVTYRPFADGNVGVPVFLWQCASGMDWERKRKTPDLALWRRIVSWAVTPKKAMAMPFALSDTEMRQHSLIVEGLLLDRHRLLEPGMETRDWISADLQTRLIDWLWPRVALLPTLEGGV